MIHSAGKFNKKESGQIRDAHLLHHNSCLISTKHQYGLVLEVSEPDEFGITELVVARPSDIKVPIWPKFEVEIPEGKTLESVWTSGYSTSVLADSAKASFWSEAIEAIEPTKTFVIPKTVKAVPRSTEKFTELGERIAQRIRQAREAKGRLDVTVHITPEEAKDDEGREQLQDCGEFEDVRIICPRCIEGESHRIWTGRA